MTTLLFQPIAEVDTRKYPKGEIKFELKQEAGKLVIYMAIVPETEKTPS